jgi:phage FluMu protein Com
MISILHDLFFKIDFFKKKFFFLQDLLFIIMVKKKGSVWKHWTIITEAESNEESNRSKKKAHPSVRCNYCSKLFEQGTSKRMQVHLNDSCPRAPDSAKTKTKQISEILESPSTFTSIPTVKVPKQHLKNITIESFVDRMSEEEQDTLEILLA